MEMEVISMTRYSLIMKDITYMALMKEALEKEVSMGRLLNDIIDSHVSGREIGAKPICEYCQKDAVYKCFNEGKRTILLCEEHFKSDKHELIGWKELG